jgi:hypothetical protein
VSEQQGGHVMVLTLEGEGQQSGYILGHQDHMSNDHGVEPYE